MIQTFEASNGRAPLPREIREQLGMPTESAVMLHLRSLKLKGALDWTPGYIGTLSTTYITPLPAPTPQFTYFFHDSVSGKIKIGCTTNILWRKRSLESSYPCEITLLLLLPSNEWPERELHFKFRADRFRGEWFNYSSAIKEFVAESTRLLRGCPTSLRATPKRRAA